MKKGRRFKVGDRVADVTTHERGRVVHVYPKRELHDDIVAVLFDNRAEALAIPADALRRLIRNRRKP